MVINQQTRDILNFLLVNENWQMFFFKKKIVALYKSYTSIFESSKNHCLGLWYFKAQKERLFFKPKDFFFFDKANVSNRLSNGQTIVVNYKKINGGAGETVNPFHKV